MALHMLRLRAATFFMRLHCPQTTFGGITSDESEDVVASQQGSKTQGVAMIEEKAKELEVQDAPE